MAHIKAEKSVEGCSERHTSSGCRFTFIKEKKEDSASLYVFGEPLDVDSATTPPFSSTV
jgi:hypothetical protein